MVQIKFIMLAEVILLNQAYKTNEFTHIRPKISDDRLVYVYEQQVKKGGAPKPTCVLAKLGEVPLGQLVSTEELIAYFDLPKSTIENYA